VLNEMIPNIVEGNADGVRRDAPKGVGPVICTYN